MCVEMVFFSYLGVVVLLFQNQNRFDVKSVAYILYMHAIWFENKNESERMSGNIHINIDYPIKYHIYRH